MPDEQRCATCKWWDGDLLAGDLARTYEEPRVCNRVVDDGDGPPPAYLHATVENEEDDDILDWSGTDDDGNTLSASLWTYAGFGCALWERRE